MQSICNSAEVAISPTTSKHKNHLAIIMPAFSEYGHNKFYNKAISNKEVSCAIKNEDALLA